MLTSIVRIFNNFDSAPLQFAQGHTPGEFYGYWVGLESLYLSDNETFISWGTVICSTRQVFGK